MDIITKARTARNKPMIMGAFALICSMGYANYSVYPLLLFVTLILFANMIDEDAKYMTVDIRKTAVLGIFFLLASKEPIGNFVLTALLALLIFRIIYLLAILKYSKRQKTAEVSEVSSKTDNLLNPIGLLPSFGAAFFLLALYLEITNQDEPVFLAGFQSFLINIGSTLSEMTIFWLLFFAFWIELEFIVKWYAKQDVEIVEGLGLGDVIVFPLFAAFLGITPFLFVLFLGCIIHIFQYFLVYAHKEG